MNIYRVIISFFRDHMQYMSERGVLAMTPGEALDRTLNALNIDRTRVEGFKAHVQTPERLEEFGLDAAIMDCIGSDMSVRDMWRRKKGD